MQGVHGAPKIAERRLEVIIEDVLAARDTPFLGHFLETVVLPSAKYVECFAIKRGRGDAVALHFC